MSFNRSLLKESLIHPLSENNVDPGKHVALLIHDIIFCQKTGLLSIIANTGAEIEFKTSIHYMICMLIQIINSKHHL
jgi:hypothetical protein